MEHNILIAQGDEYRNTRRWAQNICNNKWHSDFSTTVGSVCMALKWWRIFDQNNSSRYKKQEKHKGCSLILCGRLASTHCLWLHMSNSNLYSKGGKGSRNPPHALRPYNPTSQSCQCSALLLRGVWVSLPCSSLELVVATLLSINETMLKYLRLDCYSSFVPVSPI